MRRVAFQVLPSSSAPACGQIKASLARVMLRRWSDHLFTITFPRPSRISVVAPISLRRTLHSTPTPSQQHEPANQTATSSTPPQPTPPEYSTSSTTMSSTTSTPPPSSSSQSSSAPITVTAVATPLSRSAAAAAPADATPSPLRLLRVPDLELGDARLSKWLIQPNSHFSADCVLCELDTDMAVIEYKADRAGWLATHAVAEGDEVRVDQPIAVACDKEEQVDRVKQEWLDKVERKEKQREQRAEHPSHSLSEAVAKMKE